MLDVLLHREDSLRDLASEAPEPARSWAAALLHVWSPGAAPWPRAPHPTEPAGWHPAAAADPELPGLTPSDLAAVGCAELLTRHPHLPPTDALQAAFDAAAPSARPALAVLLGRRGALTGPQLRAVADRCAPARLAALALLLASGRDELDGVLADVVDGLDDALLTDTLADIGLLLPHAARPLPRESLADAARLGAARVGRAAPDPPSVSGSRHRRLRAWVDALLTDREDLGATVLRQAARSRREAFVGRVLVHAAAAHPAPQPSAPTSPARALAHGHLAGAIAALPHAPDTVIALLHLDESRPAGLRMAAWCPSLEVLQALLDLPVPYAPDDQHAYLWALACMGDPLAVTHADAVCDAIPELDPAPSRALSAALGLR